jgi:xylan 1,4-beta-xylosidase
VLLRLHTLNSRLRLTRVGLAIFTFGIGAALSLPTPAPARARRTGSASTIPGPDPVSVRIVSADYSRVKGMRHTFFNEVVGAGRAAEGLRADWQRDLAFVHRECGFRYIRFHGLLQDELGVYSEDKQGRPVYNFQYIDSLFDAILKIGMRPFVELGFMPNALASGNKTIFWWKGNITPPKDYDKWRSLIQALVRHFTDRYGSSEVKRWFFEVWNEPNLDLFWSGTQDDYFRLYETTSRAIKEVSPGYRVGGPATAGRGWITEMIDFAAKSQAPIDFISTHDYGVSGMGLDENGVQQLMLDQSPNAIIGGVQEVRGKIASSVMPRLQLHYTEWSTSYSPRDPVHDSYISAPYVLSKLKGSEGYADSMSYWTFTDIFEESGPVPSPFHGGFGLLSFQGLPKPSFFAYQFLNRLGETELVSSDSASWVTRNSKGVQVLFWNFSTPQTTESDQSLFKRDLPSKAAGTVRVLINGLRAGNYKVRVYKIGYDLNDVYTGYLKMGSPPTLHPSQAKELTDKNAGAPVETSTLRVGSAGSYKRDFSIRENDVCLVTIERSS